MIMSYLGSIGTLMANSDLDQVLENCYGSNTIIHMMSGEAVSRALRGFYFVESALYDHLADKEFSVATSEAPECLLKLETEFTKFKDSLVQRSRTAKLWIQFTKYVQIVKNFIRAERTGDWHLHLQVVSQMMSLFAASGHNNYTKSSRLYLQMMLELPVTHPWFYNFSNQGFHTVRRFDRFLGCLINRPHHRASNDESY